MYKTYSGTCTSKDILNRNERLSKEYTPINIVPLSTVFSTDATRTSIPSSILKETVLHTSNWSANCKYVGERYYFDIDYPDISDLILKTKATCPNPYISYTSIAPTIDGLADVCWGGSYTGNFNNVTLGTLQPDFSGSRWRALYDNSNLYILAEIKDTYLINNAGTDWYNDDCVEIFIDGDNSDGTLYDGVNDFQLGIRYNGTSIHIGDNSINNITGIVFQTRTVTGGYNLEISIPWTTIGITPVAGNDIGFDISVDDDENGGVREAQIAWTYTSNDAWQNPSVFGTMDFCIGEPDVVITQAVGQSDPASATPVNFTVTFSEIVTGFGASDITVGGTAGANNVLVSGTGPAYNVAVSGMTNDGTVTISIPAGICTDLTGNANTASVNTDNVVNYDISNPGLVITQAIGQSDPAISSPVNFTAKFSENVTGFASEDVVIGGTAGATTVVVSGTGSTYNIAVSGMAGNGTVTVSVNAGVCVDAVGKSNTASVNTDNSITYDGTSPSVILTQSVGQSDPTASSPVNFTATFSESVTGFTASDIALSGTAGATGVVISGTGPSYNLAVSGMTGTGTVIISINAGVCTDIAGNANTASINTDNTVLYDITNPGLTITKATGQSDPTGNSPINFTATFSEAVTGFTFDDIVLNGTAGASSVVISGSGSVYNIAVSGMTSGGTVLISVNAGVCYDLAGNANTASINTDNMVVFDRSSPNVSITQAVGQADPTNNSPVNFTATFSKPVLGFTSEDVVIGGSAGATAVLVSGTGAVYNIAISGMTQDGTVNVSILAGVCSDAAGNPNNESVNVDNSVIYDASRPSVTITLASGQSDPSSSSPVNFTATFSENITGFDISDVVLGGTAGATSVAISGSGAVYNIAVSGMTTRGTVTITIPQNIASDAVGNLNFASNNVYNEIDFDETKPTVVLSSTEGNSTYLARIPLVVTFSKPVNGLSGSDFMVTNGTLIDLNEQTPSEVWQAVIVPASIGTVAVQLPEGVTVDEVGNPNTASNLIQFEYLGQDNYPFAASNIFTPNSNVNRFWIIRNVGFYPDYELLIHNSNGQQIYKTTNYKNDWNGTYKNKPLPTGTYYFIFSSPDKKKVHKGFINIVYE